MGLFVSTTGADVEIPELGFTLTNPSVDYDLSGQFSDEEVARADSLTAAISSGVLVWKKTFGGAVEAPADYDPDYLEVGELNTGTGKYEDRAVVFGDILKAKSGKVSGASFAGNPKVYSVAFSTAFPDTNYSVSMASSTDSRSWLAENIVAGGFDINAQANRAIMGMVMWTAEHNGEST